MAGAERMASQARWNTRSHIAVALDAWGCKLPALPTCEVDRFEGTGHLHLIGPRSRLAGEVSDDDISALADVQALREVRREDSREIDHGRVGIDAVASLGAFEQFCPPDHYRVALGTRGQPFD